MQVGKILKLLKSKQDYVSYEQLYLELGVTEIGKEEFDENLRSCVEKLWVIEYSPLPNITLYRISNNLLPPFETQYARNQYEFYELQGSVSGQPDEWTNPHIQDLVRRNQAGRSICVGCSSAYGRDLNILLSGGTIPKAATGVRYITEIIGGRQIVRDSYLSPGSYSAECIYAWSRELGNVPTYLSGSYLSSAVAAMKARGSVLEKEWYTPLYSTGSEVFGPYPIGADQALLIAVNKKIGGYISVRDFEGIKSAIYRYGYVLMPINIYSNYTQGVNGPLPDPAGSLIGSHALCFCGYSLDRLYFLHSWEGWSFIGSISRAYWESAAGTAFAIITGDEKVEISKSYSKIYLSSNIPCDFYVNGTQVFQQPIVVTAGEYYVIRVVPKNNQYPPREIARTFTTGDHRLPFDFTSYYKTNILPTFLEDLIRKIIFRRS